MTINNLAICSRFPMKIGNTSIGPILESGYKFLDTKFASNIKVISKVVDALPVIGMLHGKEFLRDSIKDLRKLLVPSPGSLACLNLFNVETINRLSEFLEVL
jgi:hypothetical protein